MSDAVHAPHARWAHSPTAANATCGHDHDAMTDSALRIWVFECIEHTTSQCPLLSLKASKMTLSRCAALTRFQGRRLALGVDFGTDGARALVVDVMSGVPAGAAGVAPYWRWSLGVGEFLRPRAVGLLSRPPGRAGVGRAGGR